MLKILFTALFVSELVIFKEAIKHDIPECGLPFSDEECDIDAFPVSRESHEGLTMLKDTVAHVVDTALKCHGLRLQDRESVAHIYRELFSSDNRVLIVSDIARELDAMNQELFRRRNRIVFAICVFFLILGLRNNNDSAAPDEVLDHQTNTVLETVRGVQFC